MKLNNLLARQIKKHLSDDLLKNPQMEFFLQSVNESYLAFEKDKSFSDHIFAITQNEFTELRKKLKKKLQVNIDTINKLKETIGNFDGESFESDDLNDITSFIKDHFEKSEGSINTAVNDTLDTAIVMEDTQGKIIYCNNKFVSLFTPAVKRNEVLKLNLATLIRHSNFFDLNSSELYKKYLALKIKNEACTIPDLQTAENQYYELQFSPAFQDNKQIGNLLAFTNVTERKKAEIAQKEREAFQESILSNSLDAVIVINEEGEIIKWDKKAEAIFGWTEKEVVNKTLDYCIMPRIHSNAHAKGITHYLKTGEQNIFGKTLQVPAIKKDNSEITISLIISAVKNNNATQFISFIRDITETKKLEEELAKQRNFTNRILNNIPSDIAVFDVNHKYIFINKIAIKNEEIREWLIGKDDFEYAKFRSIDDSKAKKRRTIFTKVLEDKVEYEFIDKHIDANGKSQYVMRKFFPVIENGNVEFVIGYGTDITAILESENKSKVLIESSPDMIQSVDAKGEIYFVNNIWLETLGYEKEEVMGKSIFDFIAPISLAHCQVLFTEIIQSQKGQKDIEVDFLTKNGEIINTLGNVSISFEGNKIITNAFFNNISKEKLKEREILEQKYFFENILNNIPIDISVLNKDKNFIFLNKACVEDPDLRNWLLGKTFDDYVSRTGKGWEKLAVRKANIDLVIEKNQIISWNEEFLEEMMPAHYISRTISPFLSDTDDLFVIFAGMDVTDVILAKKEITRINEGLEVTVSERTFQLENSIKELDSFSYSVSHDLRSPLRAIDGWSLALLEDYGDNLDETAIGYIGRMRSEAKRMGNLIDDLLSLSKIGKKEIHRTPINFQEFCHEILNRILESSEYKQPQVITDKLVHYIYADKPLLDIMLTNLLSNAVKFSSKKETPIITLGLKMIDQKAYYFIQDNGAGFDMGNSEKLFGAFQRMHRQSDFPGTGIGLAIVKRIITLHGGEIFAESQVNKGTTFYFNFNFQRT